VPEPAAEREISDAEGLPWVKLMARRWAELLGDHAEVSEIIDLISISLAGSTMDLYGNHVARFVRWCEAQPDRPSPLPASTGTVVRWIVGDVTRGGRVKAGSLQPYLSAINRIHRDLELDEPALGHLVQQVKAGLGHRQADAGRSARRVYLPPTVVERLLTWALEADMSLIAADRRQGALYRAVVAVVLTFCFFARGGTGSALEDGHVRRSVAGVTITLDREKGKRVEGTARTITLPPGAIPGLEALLDRWEALRGSVDSTRCYFSYPGERRAFPSTQIDTWLTLCLAHFGETPPPGEKWTGHSLRKGAASGAAAVDVALHKICWCGGWSIKSKAVFDYIDPTCPRTPACRRFFGWLAPK